MRSQPARTLCDHSGARSDRARRKERAVLIRKHYQFDRRIERRFLLVDQAHCHAQPFFEIDQRQSIRCIVAESGGRGMHARLAVERAASAQAPPLDPLAPAMRTEFARREGWQFAIEAERRLEAASRQRIPETARKRRLPRRDRAFAGAAQKGKNGHVGGFTRARHCREEGLLAILRKLSQSGQGREP